MSNIIDGIVKGLSDFMSQDDPDVKIFNAQSELKELAGKEEKAYARLGRQIYETDGGKSYPEIRLNSISLPPTGRLQRNA